MLSIIWKVACVLWLNEFVKLFGSLGSPGMPAPYMPPPMAPYMPPP